MFISSDLLLIFTDFGVNKSYTHKLMLISPAMECEKRMQSENQERHGDVNSD